MGIFKTDSFLQRITEKTSLEGEIFSAAFINENDFFVATSEGLIHFEKGNKELLCEDQFSHIFVDKNKRLLGSMGNELYSIKPKGKIQKLETLEYPITDFAEESFLYILTERLLYIEKDGKIQKEQYTEQPALHIALKNNKVCVADSRCIERLEGKRKTWRCIFPDHSTMPKINILSIAFDKLGNLLVGAEEGLYLYDYKSGWYSSAEIPAFPKEKIYSIFVGENNDLLLGTDAGAVYVNNGVKKYLPAERYAFNTQVKSAFIVNGTAFTFSKGGFVKISKIEMTLEEKAYHLFKETEEYFPRKNGYVTHITGELKKGNPSQITDNDGLWTQCYLAALSMWYSFNKDEKILEAARRTKDALIFLTRASGIKGFTARAVRFPDEKDWGKGIDTLDIGSEWHRSPDGSYEWLGETSSDELSGHYLGFLLYYDYCADASEKEEIKTAICNMTDHILENNGYLLDFDNKPTTWACWNPEALNNDSMWMWEKGVNSLEMLNFLQVSYHVSGDEKYLSKYNELIEKDHFLINASHHKLADGHMCHIDDNLAMLNTLSLMLLEHDESKRQYILRGLKAHYDYEEIEGNPYFAFIYKAFCKEPCNVDMCVRALEDYPYEIEGCGLINHNRKDIEYDDEPVYWGEEPRLKAPFNWDERPVSRLGVRPFSIDSDKRSFDRSESGMSYIFIYSLGKFLGIIE